MRHPFVAAKGTSLIACRSSCAPPSWRIRSLLGAEREDGAPAQPAPLPEALLRDLHALGTDGHRVGLAVDDDFALEELVEGEWHGRRSRCDGLRHHAFDWYCGWLGRAVPWAK